MRLAAALPAPIPDAPVMIRLVDKDGYAVQFCTNMWRRTVENRKLTLTLPTNSPLDAVHLEIAWPTQVEEVALPVDLKDTRLSS
jgi:hypothetical protein